MLREDVPHGDLTTASLGIAGEPGPTAFRARGPIVDCAAGVSCLKREVGGTPNGSGLGIPRPARPAADRPLKRMPYLRGAVSTRTPTPVPISVPDTGCPVARPTPAPTSPPAIVAHPDSAASVAATASNFNLTIIEGFQCG